MPQRNNDLVAMADEESADDPDDLPLRLPALPSEPFLHHDVDHELFPADDSNDASTSAPPSGQKQRGRLRIHNVGSSLTFLLQIAFFAWGIRQLRGVLQRRQKTKALGSLGAPAVTVAACRPLEPPLFAQLSPMAVKRLVELDPTPYLLVDVRRPDAPRTESKLFEKCINVPESEVRACLQLPAAEWKERFPCAKKPALEDLIVFLSTRGKRAQRVAAAAAADLGYNGCCVLKDGVLAFSESSSAADVQGLRYLSRDAVALLLQNKETVADEKSGVGATWPWLIDLRRHDERALFGYIKGSVHIRVEEWPKALAKDPAAFEKQYHTPKIGIDDIVVLHCRTSRRASWAAYVAQDAGFKRCFVYKEGAFGWRLDPTVLPYDSYASGDVPPVPVEFQLERVNPERAQWELKQLGLL